MEEYTLKQKMSEKMLEEKLDFLGLDDSILMYQCDIKVKTKFYWVTSREELNNNGWNMSTDEIVKEVKEFYGENTDMLRIGSEEEFDEFTLVICPAPTYIDLIR